MFDCRTTASRWPASLWHGMVLLSLWALAGAAQAQAEPLVTRRGTELREAPAATARSLAQLPAQTALDRLRERSGPWLQVQVRPTAAGTPPGLSGWVHMFDLGSPTAVTANASADTGASSLLRGVTSLFNRGGSPQGSTVATSTVGVRGLSAEDLARATPNIAAVDQMETLRVTADTARQFATAAALTATSVAPLPGANNPATNSRAREGGE